SWNKAAARIFGYAPNEVIGKPISIIIPENRRNEERTMLDHIRNGDPVRHYETVRQRKDGKLVNISLTVSPLRDGKGVLIGVSKIARDITELHKTRSLASKSQHELKQRVAELTEAVGQMEEFSYSVSHDLRAPIRAMQGYAQAMLDQYGHS